MPRLRSNEAQAARCIALLVAMVRARRGVMLRPFAQRRGWNPRAAYRDIETLRDAGVQIEHEHGWYRVSADWIPASAVDVKRDELLALFVARRLAPGLKDTTVGRSLDALFSKLASPSRQTSLPLGEEGAFRGPEAAAIDLGPHRATIDAVQEAIRTRHALRIGYRKAGEDAERERLIEPSFLYWCPANEALYVRAYCRERADFRWFAIHRIMSAVLLDDPFARRPDAAWESGLGFRLWHRASAEHVSIRFSPAVAGEIRERRWHASQHLTPTLEGGVVLEMDVAAPEELERWLLGYGPDAVVLAPASLAERLRRRHAEAAGLRAGPLRARRSRTSREDAAAPAPAAGGRASARR